jgi:hypothetical protein
VKAFAAFLAFVCVAGSPAIGLGAARLQIEQSGPSDAALRPFAIEVGPLEATTRDLVYVTEAVFGGLLTSAPGLSGPGGPFRVVYSEDRRVAAVYLLDRDGLSRFLAPLEVMFRNGGVTTPPFLVALTRP